MTITAAEVRETRFASPPRSRRGYSSEEVDRFVELVATRLDTGDGLTSNDVYRAQFGKAPLLMSRGYDPAEVDSFLERILTELQRQEEATPEPPEAEQPIA